jgi:NAD-dependent deacetylase
VTAADVSNVDPLVRFAALLGAAERVLAFTGAGISTGSNIPDFRGPDGVWRTRTPVEYPEFVRSEDARVEYWTWKREGHAVFQNAKPNAGHHALVALERLGKLEALVTQNVDGLHRAAGTSADKLVELHGTNSESVCLGCGVREPIERAMADFSRAGSSPRCGRCDGLLKPGVIMFGQPLEPEDLERAQGAAARADLVLALGSSLVVTPAANVPLVALKRRVPYVIINRGATPHDPLATLKIDGDVSQVLPAALRQAFGDAALTMQ